MPFQGKPTWKGIALLLIVASVIGGTLFLREVYNSQFTWLVAHFGLPGVVGIGIFTNAPVIAPLTGFALIPFVLDIAEQHNSAMVILLYALGGAIGESTAYLVGVAGKNISQLEKRRFYRFLQKWFLEKDRRLTFSGLVFFALIPSPYDIITIAVGGVRYPYLLFFLATLLGRMGKYTAIVLLGGEFCLWAERLPILSWVC
tara:strand:- start:618 stop:1220 length:603 start_codon:yes stop_codon:yes gene_type:complete